MKTIEKQLKQQIVQRIFRNFTDIMILRLIQAQPMWGYKIKKEVQMKYGIKLRHGALYPLLNTLEQEGYIKSKKQAKGGRIRKIYQITPKGSALLYIYQKTIKEQLQ
jgi:DNA-binding PadR family transcriptional regulator